MMPEPPPVLVPGLLLFPPEQSIEDCTWLAALTEEVLQVWPRRHVVQWALQYGVPCPCGCSAQVRATLVMN